MERQNKNFTPDTKIMAVANDPAFAGFGRLIFPVDRPLDEKMTLQDLDSVMLWYSHINPARTVEIVNYLKHEAQERTVFYDIYTEAEKAADPRKKNTGLFFFRGQPGQKASL